MALNNDTVYDNKITSKVVTYFGNEKTITMMYTISRAYTALYLRIAMGVVQLLALAASVVAVVMLWKPANFGAITTIINSAIVLCLIIQLLKERFKIDLAGVLKPFFTLIIVIGLAGLAPWWGVGKLVFIAVELGLLVAVIIDEIFWDKLLLDGTEQYEIAEAEKDSE